MQWFGTAVFMNRAFCLPGSAIASSKKRRRLPLRLRFKWHIHEFIQYKKTGHETTAILAMYVHSGHVGFSLSLYHAEKLPAVPFIEIVVVGNQIDRCDSLAL